MSRTAPPGAPTGRDKTSLVLSVRDEAGVLYRVLKPFADHGINLLRIESRPLKGRPWEYVFFIDIEGHAQDPPIEAALREIAPSCTTVKVLGSYVTFVPMTGAAAKAQAGRKTPAQGKRADAGKR